MLASEIPLLSPTSWGGVLISILLCVDMMIRTSLSNSIISAFWIEIFDILLDFANSVMKG
jgi:hypothetical protein